MNESKKDKKKKNWTGGNEKSPHAYLELNVAQECVHFHYSSYAFGKAFYQGNSLLLNRAKDNKLAEKLGD